jgi:hypothetical protein
MPTEGGLEAAEGVRRYSGSAGRRPGLRRSGFAGRRPAMRCSVNAVLSSLRSSLVPQHGRVRSYRIYSAKPQAEEEEEPELGGDCITRGMQAVGLRCVARGVPAEGRDCVARGLQVVCLRCVARGMPAEGGLLAAEGGRCCSGSAGRRPGLRRSGFACSWAAMRCSGNAVLRFL